MSSNFDCLRDRYPKLYELASQAESLIYTALRASCFYTRFTVEQAVHWLYANDSYLQLPYDNNLGALIHEQSFKDNLKPGLFVKIATIYKAGNRAVHDSAKITEKDASLLSPIYIMKVSMACLRLMRQTKLSQLSVRSIWGCLVLCDRSFKPE